jgi:lysozyme family protein
MLPLVAIATSVIPDLIKLIAGDKAGAVAKDVATAVSTVTGTNDPAAAQKKLNDDPAAEAALRIKLAEIALQAAKIQNEEEDRKRKDQIQAEDQQRKNDLAELQARFQQESQRRKDEFDQLQAQLKAEIENTANARNFGLDLARANSPLQWAPAIVSVFVIAFFAWILSLLLEPGRAKGAYDDLLNIAVGALVAGFSTVISYWLGSSQGSRDKDRANREMQATQAKLNSDQINAAEKRTTEAYAKTQIQPGRSTSLATVPAPQVDNFDECLRLVLGAEGGYVDDPDDSGGPTKFGITLATLQDWRRHKGSNLPVTAQDVQQMTREEACEIYRSNYWNPLRCSDLPKGVDLVVFDFGVNAGPRRSAEVLQKVVGVEQDGSVGPITLHAVGAISPIKIIHEFSARRLELYASFPGFAKFGKGWTNRTMAMEQAALKMAESVLPKAA